MKFKKGDNIIADLKNRFYRCEVVDIKKKRYKLRFHDGSEGWHLQGDIEKDFCLDLEWVDRKIGGMLDGQV